MEKVDLVQTVIIFLCFLGSILFIFSFITEISLIGIIGLIIFAISVSFILIKPQQEIINEIFGDSFLTTLVNLNDVLKSLHLRGKGIYLPPRKNDPRNYLFVPYDNSNSLSRLPMIEGNMKRKLFVREGVLLLSIGSSIIETLEKNFALNFSTLDLNSLKETMSTLLVNELGLMNDFYMEILENKAFCIFYKSIFLNLCKRIHTEMPEFCTRIGCPLSSAIASIISKITERYVLIEECIVKRGETKTEATYRLLKKR